MILLYSWKKLLKEGGHSSKRLLTLFEYLVFKRLPKNRFDPTYQFMGKSFSGDSFLVQPELLILNRNKWRDKELADYIGLASFRNLAEYRLTKKVTLDLAHSPVGKDIINNNRLLRIADDEIHFLYEDYTGE